MNRQTSIRCSGSFTPTIFLALAITLFLGCEGNPVSVEDEGPGPDDLKVLFIGNSLTGRHNMLLQFEALADSSGRGVWIGNSVRNLTSLQDHLDYGEVFGMISSEDWDYIVLQDREIDYSIAFPDSIHHFISPYQEFRNAIRIRNPDCRIVVYLDYSDPVAPAFGETYSFYEMSQMLLEGTKALADSLGFIIAPVGWAFRTAVAEIPDFILYDSDHIHPSEEAQYLHACVYYATLFQASPRGNPYNSYLTEERAAILQRIAAEVVLGEPQMWNLP